MLTPGYYTVVYSTGAYRTIHAKLMAKGGLVGRTILGYKDDRTWTWFGFLKEDNTVQFWLKFVAATTDPVRLKRISRAVEIIATQPQKAQLAFGMCEKKCARCGRQLTQPASIAMGLGAECAGKGQWTKHDNQLAFEKQKSEAA